MPLKTIETKNSVKELLSSINDKDIKNDTKRLILLIREITGKPPRLWGTIIGFGKYKYKRKNSKEELEWFNVGIAPRKDKITLYITCYLDKEPLVEKLGKVKYSKGCIYIKKLENVNLDILRMLIDKYKNNNWYE